MTEHADAVVVGAGMAGLVAGLALARRGLHVAILERDAAPGGCVRLHTVAGLRLDRGAESLVISRPALADLVDEMSLPAAAPSGRPSWLYYRDGAAPMPSRSLLGIPAHPWARDVRRVIGLRGAIRASADRLIRPTGEQSQSLDAIVTRHVGQRIVERLTAPITAGVYSRRPDEVDADDVLPALRATIAETGSLTRAVRKLQLERPASGGSIVGITGGIGLITDALAGAFREAGGRLVCAQTVTGLVRGTHGWEVRTDGPDRRRIATPAVVIATPAGPARALLAQVTDLAALPPPARPAPVVIVTLVVDHAALDAAPRGTGLLVAPDAFQVHAKALTHATAKWPWLHEAAGPGRHVLRLSYAADATRRPGDLSDDPLIDLALADASTLLDVPVRRNELVGHSVVGYPEELTPRPRFPLPAEFPGVPGLAVAGSARTGPGLAAVIADATDAVNRLTATT